MSNIIRTWNGKHYDQHSQHQKEWGNALIQELNLSGSERILDLGCGNGHTTRQLAELVPLGEVIGIDASLEMLEVAREKCLPNMQLFLQDINEIAYVNEFDIVFSNATLHWIHDHSKLLNSIYKALKTDGFMRVQFAADGNCSTLISVLKEVMSHPRFAEELIDFRWPWFFPSAEQYTKFLSAVPFQKYSVWLENNDRFFKSETEIVAWIDNPSLIPFMQVFSENSQTNFRNKVVQKMLSLTKQADGTYFETFRRINVFASK